MILSGRPREAIGALILELERNAHAARSGSGTNNRLSELASAALAEYPEVAGRLSEAGYAQGEYTAGYFVSELSPADMLRLSTSLTKNFAGSAVVRNLHVAVIYIMHKSKPRLQLADASCGEGAKTPPHTTQPVCADRRQVPGKQLRR